MELEMALARRKSRRVNAVSIPLVCEVCRKEPVTTLVADFIFACDSCAKRIATVLCHGRQEPVVAGRISPLVATRGGLNRKNAIYQPPENKNEC